MNCPLSLKTVAVREDGCYSVLCWNGRPFAVSVERTFDDLRTVIGNGYFECVRDHYHKGGYETFEIQVKGHDRVLFHKGNLETHSLGCIIVAESFAVMSGQTAVADSKGGFAEFMELTKDLPSFHMEVTGR
jgi:hypothetical protein